MMKIGEVFCLIRNGASIKQSNGASGIPITRIETISNRTVDRNKFGYANIANAAEYQDYLLQDGDILMSHINSEKHLGKTALYRKYSGEQIIHGMNLLLLRPNAEILLADYAMYILNSEMFLRQLPRITKKSVNQASFNISALKELDVYVPSINRQKEIVSVLDKVDAMLERYKTQFKRLDDLVKSRFVEMFGEPETNPYGWRKTTVGDVCSSVVRGPFGSALKKEFFVEPNGSTYKVYEQKHAIQKSATIGTYYISAEKFGELRRFECRSGDILMSCSGTMGELFQLPSGCERGVINQALCKFTLSDCILPIVFLTYMRQTIGNLETKGSGIQNIAAVSYVKAMPINLPPMEVQRRFAAFVAEVDKSKLAVQQSLEKLETLKKSLMQQYFG